MTTIAPPAGVAEGALRRIIELDVHSDTYPADVQRIARAALDRQARAAAAARVNAFLAELVEWLEADPDNIVLLRHHARAEVNQLAAIVAGHTPTPKDNRP